MAKGDIYLGPAETPQLLDPFGRTLRIQYRETAREARTVNGTFKKDIMYTKHTIMLSWSAIDGESLDQLLTLYPQTQPGYVSIDKGLGDVDVYEVYMKPPDWERIILQSTGLYAGVEVELTEA